MRLLLLTNIFPNPYQPNLGVFNLQLARALARDHEVKVIAPIPWVNELRLGRKSSERLDPSRRSFLDGIEILHPRFYYTPGILRSQFGVFFWRSIRQTVWRLLKTYRPDAVLSYWAHPDGEAAVRVARVLGAPAAVMVGGSDVLLLAKEGRRRRKILDVLHAADVVVPVGRDLRDTIQGFGIPPAKVHVVERGIDPERFAPGDMADARRKLGLPVEGRVLLWVGRMVPVKGLSVLVDACRRLNERGRKFQLMLVGDGPLKERLEADVSTHGLAGTVTFAGPVAHAQLGDWYRAADYAVLPSLSEGVPNVLREALACGTPFVASRVGGIPELAAGSPLNRLAAPGDPAALADALDAALAEPKPAGPLASPSGSWEEAAAALVGVLRPLVADSQDGERPWWSGREPVGLTADSKVGRWRPRQLLRQTLAAVLPRRLFLVRGPADSGLVCLTFDDGPHPEHTPRVLDALKDSQTTATFFVVGRQAERHPDLIRRIAGEGHALGIHSFYHAPFAAESAGEALDGVRRTRDLLANLVGEAPVLYRPPRGKVDTRRLAGLWKEGQAVVLWNVDPRDYATPPDELAEWFRRHPLRDGDIVLFHDRMPHTAAVLPALIAAARADGLEFTTPGLWAGLGPGRTSMTAKVLARPPIEMHAGTE